ncbi:MAG TPA: SGNH/GDSL hydrolase N-terminal domain-containing protein, partial [Puia sp.]|nr:SGNH/GDSL hydrolase N-terminal domain-containing protein [Puia sp.]
MNKKFCFPIVLLFLSFIATAQNSDQFKIWDPAKDAVSALEGQAWPGEVKDFYDRLPARAEGKVRPEVWGLSKNSAGLQIRF